MTVALRPAPVTAGPPAAGHWQLRVDASNAGGDEINGFGLRAHDGTSDAGGTEYNVYYHPYTQFGINDASDTGSTDTVDFRELPDGDLGVQLLQPRTGTAMGPGPSRSSTAAVPWSAPRPVLPGRPCGGSDAGDRVDQ